MRVSDVLTVVERLPSKRPQKLNNDGRKDRRVGSRSSGSAGFRYKTYTLYTLIYKHALYARYTIRARLVIRKSNTMYL